MEQLDLIEAVAGLAAEFGNLTVIVAMQQVLEMEVEVDSCCGTCHRKAIWLNGQMELLLARYQQEFPEIDAIDLVNSRMPGLVQ